jgi:hypothetical protein
VGNFINSNRWNFEAVAAPTINDDNTLGYDVHSGWIYNGTLYICTDATSGAAVWNNVGAGGGGSLSLETDGTPNGDQTLLNLIAGSNITLTDDGVGGVTIDATDTDTGITELTGDVTAGPGSGSQAATIANDAVTFAKMQNLTTQRVIGRNTGGTGDPEEVTLSQLLDWIGSPAQGDILYRGAAGWERLPAGTDGQVLETQGTGANPQWVYTDQISFLPSDTDTSGSGTSNVNVAGAAVTLAANARYLVKFLFKVGCSGTGGFGIGLTYPSGATGTWQIVANTTAFNVQAATNAAIAASGATTGTAYAAEANPNRIMCVEVDITTSATAGTLQFIIAGKNGAQTSTIFQDGSRVITRRIS